MNKKALIISIVLGCVLYAASSRCIQYLQAAATSEPSTQDEKILNEIRHCEVLRNYTKVSDMTPGDLADLRACSAR